MNIEARAEKMKRRSSRALLLGKKLLLHWIVGEAGGGHHDAICLWGVEQSWVIMLMDVLESSDEMDLYDERVPRAFDGCQMRSPEVI